MSEAGGASSAERHDEAFVPSASAAETAKRVGKVLGAWLLGVVGVVFLAVLSVSL